MTKEERNYMVEMSHKIDEIINKEQIIVGQCKKLHDMTTAELEHLKAIESYLEKQAVKHEASEATEPEQTVEEADSDLLSDAIMVVHILGDQAHDTWKENPESPKERYRALVWDFILSVLTEAKENGGI